MQEFPKQFEALIEKYTELLIGESTEEKREMVTSICFIYLYSKKYASVGETLELSLSRRKRRNEENRW